jgi:diadenosine tetraphosphate (Ap4A) HIT family hydrolase
MTTIDNAWQLDSRLQADTILQLDGDERVVLLMNDRRWRWLILVPKVAGAEELHDLAPDRQKMELEWVIQAGEKLKSLTRCEKINIAAIGNMVRQLHIHVVARSDGDPNWPGPVWGFEKAEQYPQRDALELSWKLKETLLAPTLY